MNRLTRLRVPLGCFDNNLFMVRRTLSINAKTVFDVELKRRQRNRAASRPNSEDFDYLRTEVANRLVDRIEDIQREFPLCLDVGCHGGAHIYQSIVAEEGLGGVGGIGGVQTMVQGDNAEVCARKAIKSALNNPNSHRTECHTLMFDMEHLPFKDNSFDLVTSSLSLHWVNDVPSALKEISRVLKPDGVFIGAMLGGSTLNELRESMLLAEMEREGGVSQHISPMTSAPDMGGLLSSAGLTLATVDMDSIVCEYSDMFMLMEDLKGMGESNVGVSRRKWGDNPLRRDTLLASAAAYHFAAAGFGQTQEVDLPNTTISATFEVIYMIGWAPHESQQQPNKRGSASKSMKDISITKTKAANWQLATGGYTSSPKTSRQPPSSHSQLHQRSDLRRKITK